MIKIDNSLLDEIGLGSLPEAEKSSFLKHVYETLEMRVGIRLADQMSNEQLDEFERYFEAKDDAGAFKWLETNFPNYKDIVQQEFDKLKTEVQQSAPQILAASQAQAANPSQAAQQPQMAAPGPSTSPQASAPPANYGAPAAPAPAQPYAAPEPPQAPPAPVPPPQPQPMPEPPTPPQTPYQTPPVPQAPPQPQYQPAQPDFPAQQPPAGPSA